MSLKLEVTKLAGIEPETSYSFVKPTELAKIIQARPHSPHLINETAARELLNSVVQRISESI
jgi:hypothetical protein